MTFYFESPFCELYEREEAVSDIVDAFCSSDEANADFTAYYNSDAESDADRISDASEAYSCFEEWATYYAYDLLDDAAKNGRATCYGVTVYADAETEALEERITDMIDPWCDDECRVATFCALYNVTDAVSDIIEYIVNELDSPESFDEAAARVRLIDDIRAYRKARREKVSA